MDKQEAIAKAKAGSIKTVNWAALIGGVLVILTVVFDAVGCEQGEKIVGALGGIFGQPAPVSAPAEPDAAPAPEPEAPAE